MNAYGIYKYVRDAAWQCLIDYNISELPVNPLAIAKMTGIRVFKNSEAHLLSGCEAGASFIEDGVWYMVYDDEATRGRQRFTVAHELGYIFLGHELISGFHGRSFDTDRTESEREADVFASRLLAPACVLWGLGLHSAKDIASACDISVAAAAIRAKRMAALYKRDKFLTHPLERRVYKQFEGFIDGNRR